MVTLLYQQHGREKTSPSSCIMVRDQTLNAMSAPTTLLLLLKFSITCIFIHFEQ
jgi:hypothetical protein